MTQTDFIHRFGDADPREVYNHGVEQYFKLLDQRDALQPMQDEIKRISHELVHNDMYIDVYRTMTAERDRLTGEYNRQRTRILSDLRHYTNQNKQIDLLLNAPTVGGRGVQQDGSQRQEVAA